ncbi:hypothetical protein DL93DRAFT_2227375 [Clavulina sp. PMI_390]|nr:hypothetical protein DL93DRAFT_2227375 [Clavulina sp. PMI_390]
MSSEVASELSREEKRALRKAEKRKAKFGPDANENGGGPIPKTYKGKGKATDLVLPGAETDIHTSKSEKKVKKRDRETEIGTSTAERASKKQRKSADATLGFATAESLNTTLPTEVVDPKKKDRKVKKEKKRSIEATENQEVAASLPASTKIEELRIPHLPRPFLRRITPRIEPEVSHLRVSIFPQRRSHW